MGYTGDTGSVGRRGGGTGLRFVTSVLGSSLLLRSMAFRAWSAWVGRWLQHRCVFVVLDSCPFTPKPTTLNPAPLPPLPRPPDKFSFASGTGSSKKNGKRRNSVGRAVGHVRRR